MAKRPTQPPATVEPPKLLIPINEAREKLITRRDAGVTLLKEQDGALTNYDDLERANSAFDRWSDFNRDMIRRMFNSDEYSNAYSGSGSYGIIMTVGGRDFRREVKEHFELFRSKIEYLESLAERLDLFDDPKIKIKNSLIDSEIQPQKSTRKVFIVHGRDEETKAIVARFISQCRLEPIILHERPDEGFTIIEKFEKNADVSFAVVLLTPDDIGGPASPDTGGVETNLKPRARQNVILELGYFIGRLRRSSVCALRKGDVEIPSDFSGVVYIPYDGADEGWKLKLAREFKTAGLEVDMNSII